MRTRWLSVLFLALACCAGLAVPRSDRGNGGQLYAAVIFSEDMGDPDDTDGVSRSGGGGESSGLSSGPLREAGSGKWGRNMNSTISQKRQANCIGRQAAAGRAIEIRTEELIRTWLKYYLLTARR